MSLRTLANGRFRGLASWLDLNRLFAQRVLIIPPLLLLVAALAFVLPRNFHVYVMVLPAAIGGAVFFLRYPPLRTMFMIIVSMTTRLIFFKIGLTIAVLFGLTGLWLLDMITRQRRIAFVKSPTIPPLLLFVAVVFISFGLGQLSWYPIAPAPMTGQIGQVMIFVSAICAFLLAAHQVNDVRWLQIFLYTFLILGTVFFLGRFFPRVAFFQGFLVDPTAVGSPFWTWMVAAAMSQAIFNKKVAVSWRVVFAGITGLALYVALFMSRAWTSGWMPMLLAVAVILWVGKPKLALLLTGFVGLALLINFQTIYDEYLFIGDNDYSLLTRLEAWRIVFAIIKVNPILGLGPANYRSYTTLYPILGYYVEFNSHNNYIDLIAQVGFVGFGIFMWILFEIGMLAWRLRKIVPPDGFAQAYVYGTFGGWVATVFSGMLGDWIVPFYYNGGANAMRASVMTWLFFGGLVALEQLYVNKPKEEELAEITGFNDLVPRDFW